MRRAPDWKKFHRWEEEYDAVCLRKLTPVEKIKSGEELYETVERVLGNSRFRWDSDEKVLVHYKKFLRKRA